MEVIGAIVIGFIVGVIARIITPGPSPRGFILTTVLGIVGALVATYLGQAIHLLQPGQPANFLGAIVGAVIVLLVWGQVVRSRT
jgi:uncharacterized membrane protein YeaQ/YmgE (transglycosylase-associated protein family)